MKRPYLALYTRDWLDDQALRRCSSAARGLLADLMCLMQEGIPYGHLTDDRGEPLTEKYLTGRLALTTSQYRKLMAELEAEGRVSRDEHGSVFCRRMVKDEATRLKRILDGGKGGNTKLSSEYNVPGFIYLIQRESDSAVKIGIAKNPQTRIWKLRSQSKGDTLEEIGTFAVDDMGLREMELHRQFEHLRVQGEWFRLTDDDIGKVATSLKGSKSTSVNTGPRACVARAANEIEIGVNKHSLLGDFAKFQEAAIEAGLHGSESDWDQAKYEWNRLDFEQKTLAVKGLRERKVAGEFTDPAYRPLPQNYLKKRTWQRPVRASPVPNNEPKVYPREMLR